METTRATAFLVVRVFASRQFWHRAVAVIVLSAWLGLVAAQPQVAARVVHRFQPDELYRQSVAQNVCVSTESSAIVLQNGVLYEDDGPAAGYSYQPNQETLSDKVCIKKELLIANPHSREATLLLGATPAKAGGNWRVTINGQVAQLEPAAKQGNYWQAWEFDPQLLRSGKNEIVLSGEGKIWIARDDAFAAGSTTRTRHPNRSAKSSDGGKTWDYDHLGPQGDLDGEYYVRVFLDQPQPDGSVVLPVVDVGSSAGTKIAPYIHVPDSVRITVVGKAASPQGLTAWARSGGSYVPGPQTWSDWQALRPTGGTLTNLKGRFVQVAVELAAEPAAVASEAGTPLLQEISIAAEVDVAGDWSSQIKVLASQNDRIHRTAIPFEYEAFEHPALKKLRSDYKLDEVVSNAKDEFELITRLAAWSAKQWQRGHLAEAYPAWNALEILQLHADGEPVGGFCQHYNLVFLQACQSFGLVGRAVSISQGSRPKSIKGSGHEVVEIWSNQHQKWIYVDGNCAWYARDAESELPLSLWELRQRQLSAVDDQPTPKTEIITLAETRYRWPDLASWPPFIELRLIPRNNFLSQPCPVPLNQGMRGWFWTGHFVWDDAEAPAALLYGNRVQKRENWEWTLNQAYYHLEATRNVGELRVHLATVTPGFATFVVETDALAAQAVESGFLWKLHPGENVLKVVSQNKAGRNGNEHGVKLQFSD